MDSARDHLARWAKKQNGQNAGDRKGPRSPTHAPTGWCCFKRQHAWQTQTRNYGQTTCGRPAFRPA
eukprot:4350392-Lingulodinium_polyedra.AAC.1